MDAHAPPTVEALIVGEYANLLAEAHAALVEARALLRKTHGDLEDAGATILQLQAKIVDHGDEDEVHGDNPPDLHHPSLNDVDGGPLD